MYRSLYCYDGLLLCGFYVAIKGLIRDYGAGRCYYSQCGSIVQLNAKMYQYGRADNPRRHTPRDYPTENIPEVTPRGSFRVRMPPSKSDRVMQECGILLVFKFSLSLHSAGGLHPGHFL